MPGGPGAVASLSTGRVIALDVRSHHPTTRCSALVGAVSRSCMDALRRTHRRGLGLIPATGAWPAFRRIGHTQTRIALSVSVLACPSTPPLVCAASCEAAHFILSAPSSTSCPSGLPAHCRGLNPAQCRWSYPVCVTRPLCSRYR